MAITFIAKTAAQAQDFTGQVTTSPIDTTGTNLIVVWVVGDNTNSAVVSDNKGNTWTALPLQSAGSPTNCGMSSCLNPIVGVNHTFTNLDNISPAIFVCAFSGAGVFGSQTGAGVSGGASNIQPGALDASDGELLVTGVGFAGLGIADIDSGFTLTDHFSSIASAFGGGMAYRIVAAAASVDPTWQLSFSPADNGLAATMAGFLAPAAVIADASAGRIRFGAASQGSIGVYN